MKTMFAGFAATVCIAVVAGFALNAIGLSSQAKHTGGAVRLDSSR